MNAKRKEAQKAAYLKYYETHRAEVNARRRELRKLDPERHKKYGCKYYAEHREKLKAKSKAWAEANPEKRLECERRWREEHLEQVRATHRNYLRKHPEKKREYDKRYIEKHPEYRKRIEDRRRKYHPRRVIDYTQKQRLAVLRLLCNGTPRCANVDCGCSDLSELQINHLIRTWGVGPRPDEEKGLKLYNRILSNPKIQPDYDVRCSVCNTAYFRQQATGAQYKIIYLGKKEKVGACAPVPHQEAVPFNVTTKKEACRTGTSGKLSRGQ